MELSDKGIASLEQNQIFKLHALEPDVVSFWFFKLRLFDLTEFMFEISKVCNSWFQRCDKKVRVCGKDSVSLPRVA